MGDNQFMLTRYGKSVAAGGWDGVGDSGTDAGLGCANNKLVDGLSCALSKPAEALLGVKVGTMLEILGSNGVTYLRRFDDRTDQTLPEKRIDFYCEWQDDPSIPDTGRVLAVRPLAV
jgi:hypothetical protein